MKNAMKKLLTTLILIFALTSTASAASLYTTTIMDVSAAQVQDALIEIFTGKNFTIDEVTPYTITFQKSFNDGVWLATKLNTVKCNLIERDGNVKLMVSQMELIGGQTLRKRSIDHLVPLLSEVKHVLDGTPIEEVHNEAVNQLPGSGNEREKELGLVLGENGEVTDVKPGSVAHGKIAIGDAILEINGMSLNGMDREAVKTYIANKWGSGASLILLVQHDGEKNFVTVKKGE
ncbi:hypothetical protein B5F39_12070 [Cloacibacillus sp. An23]|nr:hypothetical protein B5F39_12070 [Cloacibacillus sp. An23]